jgi:IS5 family transposase
MRQKTQNKFLSNTIYQELVPQNSFWRKVNTLINWPKWEQKLSLMYSNTNGGNPNWSPQTMLKILLIQRVYNCSDRKTQELCTQNIMVKFFLGLEIQEESPDYSTISKFRSQILNYFGANFYEEFFQDILVELQNVGLTFSGTYAVDSTISDADVNTWKDKQRKEVEGKLPRDQDATWTAKSRPSKNNVGNNTVFYYGYKTHTAVDLEKNIITAIIPTTAKHHDAKFAQPLIEKTQLFTDVKRFTADAAYDDAFLIHDFEKQGIDTAVRVKSNRTKQNDLENETFWRMYMYDTNKVLLRKKRSRIERTYADLKCNHGMRRNRYIGIKKFSMQSYLSATAYNIKIGIKLLFNVSLGIV